VFTDGRLWTHNDSGNPSEIYNVDTTDGHIIQTVVVDNFANVDWEDITADSNYIYIGDHGNNSGTRKNLRVLKIAKSDITSASTAHVNAQAIAFSYTDQTSFASSSTHNFDCEALISIKDSLYIFTKDRGDLQTRVYKMPKTPGTYALTPYTGFNVNGLITGADYNASTHEIVLIGYFSGHSNSFLWFLKDFKGDMFFSGNKRRIEIANGLDWQTEGVCYQSDSRIFLSCEQTDAVDASVFACTNNWNTTEVKSFSNRASYVAYPNPATGYLHIDNEGSAATYAITDMMGSRLAEGQLTTGSQQINLQGLAPGIYTINITNTAGERAYIRVEKQ
jgi:hypothetical protein